MHTVIRNAEKRRNKGTQTINLLLCIPYYYVFYDFDGFTGCDIPQRLTDYDYKYLLNIAQHVYRLYEQDVQNKNKKEKIK